MPRGHSTRDQGLCSSPRMGASLATAELYSSLPRTCFKAVKREKQGSELFSGLPSYTGKGSTLSQFLGLVVPQGLPSALSMGSRGLRWLACFLGGLAFPVARPRCAHCLREKKCQIRKWSNGAPCWSHARLRGFADGHANLLFLTWERRLTFFKKYCIR